MIPKIYDKNEHELQMDDIVDHIPNIYVEGKGYQDVPSGQMQVDWDDAKHGYVLVGIGGNIERWKRDWNSSEVTYNRKGYPEESFMSHYERAQSEESQ